ncbi:MAG: glycine zipper 2TM domain-containing protein [Acidobacteriota bacterium]
MKASLSVAALLSATILLSGCAPSMSNRNYSLNEAYQPMNVQYGTVDAVRSVLIQGVQTGVGPMAGAVIGGAAGNAVGGGNGQIITTVAGALLGGLAGAAAEEGASRQEGQQITIHMDDGRLIAVVQSGKVAFTPGERVQVLTAADGTTRVEAAPVASR